MRRGPSWRGFLVLLLWSSWAEALEYLSPRFSSRGDLALFVSSRTADLELTACPATGDCVSTDCAGYSLPAAFAERAGCCQAALAGPGRARGAGADGARAQQPAPRVSFDAETCSVGVESGAAPPASLRVSLYDEGAPPQMFTRPLPFFADAESQAEFLTSAFTFTETDSSAEVTVASVSNSYYGVKMSPSGLVGAAFAGTRLELLFFSDESDGDAAAGGPAAPYTLLVEDATLRTPEMISENLEIRSLDLTDEFLAVNFGRDGNSPNYVVFARVFRIDPAARSIAPLEMQGASGDTLDVSTISILSSDEREHEEATGMVLLRNCYAGNISLDDVPVFTASGSGGDPSAARRVLGLAISCPDVVYRPNILQTWSGIGGVLVYSLMNSGEWLGRDVGQRALVVPDFNRSATTGPGTGISNVAMRGGLVVATGSDGRLYYIDFSPSRYPSGDSYAELAFTASLQVFRVPGDGEDVPAETTGPEPGTNSSLAGSVLAFSRRTGYPAGMEGRTTLSFFVSLSSASTSVSLVEYAMDLSKTALPRKVAVLRGLGTLATLAPLAHGPGVIAYSTAESPQSISFAALPDLEAAAGSSQVLLITPTTSFPETVSVPVYTNSTAAATGSKAGERYYAATSKRQTSKTAFANGRAMVLSPLQPFGSEMMTMGYSVYDAAAGPQMALQITPASATVAAAVQAVLTTQVPVSSPSGVTAEMCAEYALAFSTRGDRYLPAWTASAEAPGEGGDPVLTCAAEFPAPAVAAAYTVRAVSGHTQLASASMSSTPGPARSISIVIVNPMVVWMAENFSISVAPVDEYGNSLSRRGGASSDAALACSSLTAELVNVTEYREDVLYAELDGPTLSTFEFTPSGAYCTIGVAQVAEPGKYMFKLLIDGERVDIEPNVASYLLIDVNKHRETGYGFLDWFAVAVSVVLIVMSVGVGPWLIYRAYNKPVTGFARHNCAGRDVREAERREYQEASHAAAMSELRGTKVELQRRGRGGAGAGGVGAGAGAGMGAGAERSGGSPGTPGAPGAPGDLDTTGPAGSAGSTGPGPSTDPDGTGPVAAEGDQPQLPPTFGVASPAVGGQGSRPPSTRLSRRSRASTNSHTSEILDAEDVGVADEGQGHAVHGVAILDQIAADLDAAETHRISVPAELLADARPYWVSRPGEEPAPPSTAEATAVGTGTGAQGTAQAQSAGLVAPVEGLPSGPGTALAPGAPGQRSGALPGSPGAGSPERAGGRPRAREREAVAYSFCGEGVTHAAEPATVFVASLPDRDAARAYQQQLLLYTRAPGQPMLRLRALKMEHVRHSRHRREARPPPSTFREFCAGLPGDYLVVVVAEPVQWALGAPGAPASAAPPAPAAFAPLARSLRALGTALHPRRAWGSLGEGNAYLLPGGGLRLGLPAPPEAGAIASGATGAQLLEDLRAFAELASAAAPGAPDAVRAALGSGGAEEAWAALEGALGSGGAQ